MTFVHELDEANGYAYVYRKTLRLEGDTMVLDHTLRNTGRKRIETSVYNHNFFTLDRRPTGPQVSVTFPFDAKATRAIGPLATLVARDLRFARELAAGETVFTELEGFGTGTSRLRLPDEARGDRRRRAHPQRSTAHEDGLLVRAADRVPGTLRRRQRRSRPDDDLADHVRVLGDQVACYGLRPTGAG